MGGSNRFILGVVALSLLAVGVPAAISSDATVDVFNFGFSPVSVSIQAGEDVTWHWSSGTHSIVENGSGAVWCATRTAPAADCARTFPSLGAYHYHCGVHPSMEGTVQVVDANAPDLVVTGMLQTDDGFTRHVDITVSNVGINGAPATIVVLTYASLLEALTTIGMASVGALAGGASSTVRVDWDTTGSVGDFTLTAQADFGSEAVELDEGNNELAQPSTVLVGGIPGVSILP